MAFEIGPVAGVSPTLPTGYLKPAAAPATDGSAFASALGGAVDQVQSLQATSNDLSIKAVTGDLTDIHAATLGLDAFGGRPGNAFHLPQPRR